MEEVTKNAGTFLHILEIANSSQVCSWGPENLKKAINWADHHQQIYNSYVSREKIRSVLDVELRKLAFRNCILINLFGFNFLRTCKDFLISTLSQNSSLPAQLHHTLPEPQAPVQSTQIFGSFLNIPSHLDRGNQREYLDNVIRTVCKASDEALDFQERCPVTTLAPQRSITTLMSRVYKSDPKHSLFLKCFIRGSRRVQDFMSGWLGEFGVGLWREGEVKHLVKCASLSPAICKLYIQHILQLFTRSLDLRLQHRDLLISTEPEPHSDNPLIFGGDNQKLDQDVLHDLSEHIVMLHASSCAQVVEELLLTLSKHPRYDAMALSYLHFFGL